ncbi:diguanylate cyclase (GGDEF)-like protein [Methylorubrum rhodinum]|uniref:Diguanylate cyclase (GGDEF)-like protein n=1 Tax=Methylorubrum rhodinum TaxID=29428 RepID=A0A840ZQM6_9HYPH|nr:EAL domain-containing protein [Methylorubrum rhodinum]MBB5759454.1 diguanylate cyclase (GGDEF)-like protein [Methylorubrum rhodinum]
MADKRKASWGSGELYDLLCLMMLGTCVWLLGVQLGAFRSLDRLIIEHNLADLFKLGFFMGLGAVAASASKSLRLRRAMRERDAAEARAAETARHDPLTGLANRRLFAERLDERRAGGSGGRLSVFVVDLDRFKPVNELYGYEAGNAVLRAVGERLVRTLPAESTVARLDGDEFAALVESGPGGEGLARLAQGLIAALSAPVTWLGHEIKVGATVGIAAAGPEAGSAQAVLHAADLAMGQGKRDGRGTYRVFESAMDEALKARARLEADLRVAIDAGQIEPYYQPVVALPGQTVTGFEVLARWRHPEHGLLMPSAFIPVAEETGMIGDLSYLILRRACLDARAWPNHLQLAVNIAPQQFQDSELALRILAILTETGFQAHRLEVEITETAIVQDLEATRATLGALQALGVRVALDDFGTGYSSLYHLRELRFDKLKIDRSYVDSIAEDHERAKLVDAIIKLGNSLGLVTTAEGIETKTSVDWLASQGCDFGQGYLFGKPMPRAEIDRRLNEGLLDTGPVAPKRDAVSKPVLIEKIEKAA